MEYFYPCSLFISYHGCAGAVQVLCSCCAGAVQALCRRCAGAVYDSLLLFNAVKCDVLRSLLRLVLPVLFQLFPCRQAILCTKLLVSMCQIVPSKYG